METNVDKGKRHPPPSDTEGGGEDLQLLLQNFSSLSSDAQQALPTRMRHPQTSDARRNALKSQNGDATAVANQ